MATMLITAVGVVILLGLGLGILAVGGGILFVGGVLYAIYKIILFILKELYFRSEAFLEHKDEVDSMVKEYNEIAEYVKDIPNKNQFVPKENKHEYSHLAEFKNTSKHNYKRNRNVRSEGDANVYPASLQVVKRASEEPIKYLCKYFNIDATEDSLNQLQEIGENISRMENTIKNLELRQKEIEDDFNPPKFILKHYRDELMERVGANLSKIEPEYVEYVFEYVSPGGNSSQKAVIKFNSETVEAVSEYIAEKIKYRNSAKGQRALMTKTYREKIKKRDNYTCQMCKASVEEQSLLLLEVDHIIPISKGGKSVDENLQTLCWKCNRTKSDKIIA